MGELASGVYESNKTPGPSGADPLQCSITYVSYPRHGSVRVALFASLGCAVRVSFVGVFINVLCQ